MAAVVRQVKRKRVKKKIYVDKRAAFLFAADMGCPLDDVVGLFGSDNTTAFSKNFLEQLEAIKSFGFIYAIVQWPTTAS